MSSLRNSVQRRNHKERAQPLKRARWGLLEKHKDYALRAQDHASKRGRLAALRAKAAARNPDEFSFGMASSATVRGRKVADRGNMSLTEGVVRLLKTQDIAYVRQARQLVKQEIREVEEGELGGGVWVTEDSQGTNVHGTRGVRSLVGGKGAKEGNGPRVVFVESAQQQDEWKPDERGTRNGTNGGSNENVKSTPTAGREKGWKKTEEAILLAARKERIRLRTEKRHVGICERKLEALHEKELELAVAEQKIDEQRARMRGGTGGVNSNGVMFKMRRRR